MPSAKKPSPKNTKIERQYIPITRGMFPKRMPEPETVLRWKTRWPRIFAWWFRLYRAFLCRREPVMVKADLMKPGIVRLHPGQSMLWKVGKHTETYLINTHRWHMLKLEVIAP